MKSLGRQRAETRRLQRSLLDPLESQRAGENKNVKHASEDDEDAAGKEHALLPQGWKSLGNDKFLISDLRRAKADA